MYASFKATVWGAVPAGGDATEILLGFTVFLIALLVFRRPLKAWSAIVPVAVVGGLVALLDVLALGQGGLAALRDLLLFLLLPLVLVLAARMNWLK